MMLFPNRCMIKRYEKGDKSPTGAIKMVLKTIYETLPCYFEPTDGVVIVPQEGQTNISYLDMFCDLNADIKPNDVVIDLDTNESMKVLDVNNYLILKHKEVRLQGGTIK